MPDMNSAPAQSSEPDPWPEFGDERGDAADDLDGATVPPLFAVCPGCLGRGLFLPSAQTAVTCPACGGTGRV